ncbi:methyl-accepting chemotaxis protein [Colwellia sp. 75C3]|uniref:methyl-accepting chemotaxis protein n=1 Tax=Colwellia sp. 75C3 TaxID=888425 RepID=UPI000C324DFB|nr:methyl-accepting chemotaxis protein [Colwellia sp. 75C3]PKG80784.1 methyl-accepting chemotaxis protein [Colwellia sp. 75C3]
MKLKIKLLITFLSVSLIPMILMGAIASYVSSSAIEKQAFSQLVAVREIKKSQIEGYFEERKGDIEVLSGTIQKVLDFSSAAALNASAHDNHQYFETFIKAYGYYDFFIIDNSGGIFYTVTKEADYQTNLVVGQYKDSNLGQLFRRVNDNNTYGMSDFSRYAPSNGDPAGFIALPFTTSTGVSVVIALQLSIEKINGVMQERAGMGDTGESYLVGSDLLMRSDSFLDPKGHSVTASFAGNVKQNGVNTEGANLAIEGKTGQKIIIDYNGNPVLSAYTAIELDGIRWGLLSEIDVAEAFEPIQTLYWNIVTIILLFIVVIVGVALSITKSIITPLGGEPGEMKSISETIAKGDLTVDFDTAREMQGVYGSMKQMANHLLGVVSEIIDNSNNLASSAEETSALSLQSSVSLEAQQSSIEQVATAVEEMSTSINEVAMSATNAANSAQAAQHSSNEANNKLRQTISDLGQLDNEISSASAVIQTLETDSHEIGSVLEVIRGIADQTNLLALNAAIEAARAGDQGRGFAVVADEVRTLASKTQESTKNIEDMIGKLQSASNDAVKAMKTSRSVCEHTLSNAHTTAQMIHTMNGEIGSITQMTELIATAVEEQSCVSNEIAQNITTISDVAYENSAAATQVSTAGQDISVIASKLNQLTQQFTVA